MTDRSQLAHNRASWNAEAAEYQARNAAQIDAQMQTGDITWGVWGIPESVLNLLGDVEGREVLELGCGAAQWSLALATRGARMTGLDLSDVQLEHARANIASTGRAMNLVQASGEEPPFADGSFDIVFADYGGFSFGDPFHTIPNAARMLRPGGRLVFTTVSPLLLMTWPEELEHPGDRLLGDYFGMHRIDQVDTASDFNLPYGQWIDLFLRNGLVIEGLLETRPSEDATSTYRDESDREWARRWPAEIIWRARKP